MVTVGWAASRVDALNTRACRFRAAISGRGSYRRTTTARNAPTSCSAPAQGLTGVRLPALGDAITKEDYGKFVRFMHLASPYVVGHRGRTFVITIPGEVVSRKDRLHPLLEDITLLHGLGVRVVIVVGARKLIDDYQRQSGKDPTWVGAYRVTDGPTLAAAISAAGSICTEISACLSKGPSIPMVRRHARGEGQFHFAPPVQVVSGNYVTAKRRGIVNGVDFEFMGQVRFVQREAVRQQLDAGNVVVLTNVGVSASGELLNCNSFDVATHAAVELQADKLIIFTGHDVRPLALPHYLPLHDAEALIVDSVCADDSPCCVTSSLDVLGQGRVFSGSEGEDTGDEEDAQFDGWDGGWRMRNDVIQDKWELTSRSSSSSSSSSGGGEGRRRQRAGRSAVTPSPEMTLDLDSWQQIGFPSAVLAAVVACKQGVKRAHLVDYENDGAILLELYTRDGITGVCMISADLYEGIRPAEARDIQGVQLLLQLLQEDMVPFPPSAAADHLGNTTVIEREGKVLGCCYVADLGEAEGGVRVAELAAFVIDPSYRRQGFGDSLLDYVEQTLRRRGYKRVVVIASEGSWEWFAQRAFALSGDAATSPLLPERRRATVPAVSQLYAKPILDLDASLDAPAGKRIGF